MYAALLCVLLLAHASLAAQPRLVVVISFDQFRGDMPQTFDRFFGPSGFRRITREGTTFPSCYFEHANTITGPGHAALLTGCYPARTGIVGNDFCDLETGLCVYCADDDSGVKSASQLRVPTLGDLLRGRNPNSKVVGVALKDRAAILMAGPMATSCVWYDPKGRAWTSSAAFPSVPWLTALNASVTATRYAGATWRTRIPAWSEPAFDSVSAEGVFPGGSQMFPHRIPPANAPTFMNAVLLSPFSLDMVFDAATMALRKERLGRDAVPDLLCVGVSTTDFVGHTFGPDSREVQELFVHADRRLGRFIDELDRTVGRKHYVLVVTSDHGVAPIPEVIRDLPQQQHARIDAGRIREAQIKRRIDSILTARYGPSSTGSYVRTIEERSVWLTDTLPEGQSRSGLVQEVVGILRQFPGLGFVAARDEILRGVCPDLAQDSLCALVRASTHPTRTGDVVMYPKRYWIIGGNVATHGTPHDYDRHVPLMMMGHGIGKGISTRSVAPVDIAPTLAKMLGLDLGGVDGRPLPLP